MRKWILAAAAAAIFVAPGIASAQSPILIKFSHVVAPNTPKGKGADKFKELAEKYTNGKVKVEVYPNSTLYKDKEELEALQLGAVQMLAPSNSKFGPMGIKDFEVFDLPFLLPNEAALRKVTEGPLGQAMITVPELAAEALGSYLAEHMGRRFGSTDADLIELVQSAARLALDCIGNSDALYHNVEHTMLVTLVGYDILRGRRLLTDTSASDYAHILVACLFHDIGYVRGILNGDSDDGFIVDAKGGTARLPRGSSDAALLPYHVDRSKLFVMDRVKLLDATRIANAIEATRFPPSIDASEDGVLVRAADLIGQLGDPHYLRKANALYYEFEEVGMNKQLGYTSPADLIDLYPKFFWSNISTQIESAIRYLNVTSNGRQWIANLYSNVSRAERELSLCGPQR